MNKLTDNEIIKALEICTDEHMGCEDGCPYRLGECLDDGYRSKPMKDALDLINRQKAEIFNLNKEISTLKLKNDEFLNSSEKAKAEIEKKQSAYELCKQEYESMFNANRNLLAEVEKLKEVTTNTVNSSIKFGPDKEKEIRKAKSEAYREFAERIKEGEVYMRIDFPNTECGTETYIVLSEDIDNTLKELTESKNDFEG